MNLFEASIFLHLLFMRFPSADRVIELPMSVSKMHCTIRKSKDFAAVIEVDLCSARLE